MTFLCFAGSKRCCGALGGRGGLAGGREPKQGAALDRVVIANSSVLGFAGSTQSGKLLGTAEAERTSRAGRIESFNIPPPGEKAQIQIGRFAMSYELL